MSQRLNDKDHKEKPVQEKCSLDFADIFRDFERPIHNYLLHLTQNQTEAEDLAQETFIRVHERLETFRGESSLRTWIYRIATNVAIDHFRSSAARQETASQSFEEEFDGEQGDTTARSPEHQVAKSEMSDCVQGHIQQLPLSYRTVLLLHDVQGLRTRDIADVLDCSVDTVKIRIHRARNRLRESLAAGCDLDHDERNVLVCEPNALDQGRGRQSGPNT
jgi:RNA polymerase sigma-70 factor (ECF subfamily)